MTTLRSVLVAVLCLAAYSAQATPAGATYYGQSLLCHEKSTGAVCMLWLDADGRYTVFYQTPPGSEKSAARLEGRQGAFAAQAVAGGVTLCLRPDPDPVPRRSAGIALFHDQSCIGLPIHPIGEPFTLSFAGQDYTLLLAQGR